MAASQGYLSLIKLRKGLLFSVNAMDYAAENGHLEIVQWLHINRTKGCTKNAIDEAARNGYSKIVQ